jgi:hypothetical protein
MLRQITRARKSSLALCQPVGSTTTLIRSLGRRYNVVDMGLSGVIRMGTQARVDGKSDRAVRAAKIDVDG